MQQNVQPISSLTPYMGNRWTIKGRVTDKSDVRTWNKPNSSGKLVSFTLIDETASVRATMFNGAVDRFNDMLLPNQVFTISGGQVKTANKRFSNVNNEYEITLDEATVIEASRDGGGHIPQQRYNFVPIAVLEKREANTMCDILCVVVQTNDVTKAIQKATGAELIKRTCRVADKTSAVDLTFWGDQALSFNQPPGTVLAVKNVRIGSFDGCSLSTTMSSTTDVEPNISDTPALKSWFKTTGASDVPCISGRRDVGDMDNTMYRGRKFYDDIQAEGLGRGEKADFIDIRCTPFYVRADRIHYESCPTCNKKVQGMDNAFRCEKCNRDVANPELRYMTSIHVSDNVSTFWVTLFNEAGEQFFGMSARDLSQLPNLQQYLHSRLLQPIVMRLRVKEDRMGQDAEDRMQITGTRIRFVGGEGDAKINAGFTDECAELIKAINAY